MDFDDWKIIAISFLQVLRCANVDILKSIQTIGNSKYGGKSGI